MVHSRFFPSLEALEEGAKREPDRASIKQETAPIKQMPRYLNLGATGEVEQLSNPEQASDLPRRADYLR